MNTKALAVDRYVEYHRRNAVYREIDTHLDAAVYLADLYGMSEAQRAFFAFLNACCETTPTALWIWSKFKTLKEAKQGGISDFVLKYSDDLPFQYDVRWIRYKFDQVFESYWSRSTRNGRSEIEEIRAAAIGRTDPEIYYNFCKNFKIHMFGTYVSYLYTELLSYVCGVRIPVVLDPATNHSVRSGLIYSLGLEREIFCVKKGSVPTPEELRTLKAGLEEVRKRIEELNISDRHKTLWAIETTLCTFNKFNHGKRWLGFYQQRQKKEIKRMCEFTKRIGDNFDWSVLHDYRLLNFGVD